MKNNLVVIPFNTPWNWSTDFTNQTALKLAKDGNVVVCSLLCETVYLKDFITDRKFPRNIYRYSKNIYLVKPIYIIPFRKSNISQKANIFINSIILKVFAETLFYLNNCKERIFWIFDPNQSYVYKWLGNRYLTLFDCVDFFPGSNEINLAKSADIVVANSNVLRERLLKYRKNVKLVPQGFRVDDYLQKKETKINLNIKKPVIGFVGGINNRLDFDILLPLIKNNPRWNFVLWGPIQEENKFNKKTIQSIRELKHLKNVTFGESKDKSEIPSLISQFDVGIIPYDISQDFNRYCYPMKLFEYFQSGIPVVSTNIIELQRFPSLVFIGNNANDWGKHIKNIIAVRWPKGNIVLEKKLAFENSWSSKINSIYKELNKNGFI